MTVNQGFCFCFFFKNLFVLEAQDARLNFLNNKMAIKIYFN